MHRAWNDFAISSDFEGRTLLSAVLGLHQDGSSLRLGPEATGLAARCEFTILTDFAVDWARVGVAHLGFR